MTCKQDVTKDSVTKLRDLERAQIHPRGTGQTLHHSTEAGQLQGTEK